MSSLLFNCLMQNIKIIFIAKKKKIKLIFLVGENFNFLAMNFGVERVLKNHRIEKHSFCLNIRKSCVRSILIMLLRCWFDMIDPCIYH